MTNTEIINPPHPGKIELIEEIARRIEGPWRFVDLGGLWAVHGAYAFHALAQPGCVGGTMVDTHPTRTFLDSLAQESRLAYVKGNFGDRTVFGSLPPFDVVFLFDTLLHQVRPDWHEILQMYAERASHILIFNQQYTGDRTVRLLDLGEDEYFQNVPHDPKHPTYADLFDKLDQKHPVHDRNWRDVHHIWQWGIVDRDLIATMAELGFEPVFSRNWGQVLNLQRFENHAFIFSRVRARAAAPAETANTAAHPATRATSGLALPDQLPALAAINDGGALTGMPAGEQLRLLRNFRRALRPGGSLLIETAEADGRTELMNRARYAGFTDATAHANGLALRAPDRRLSAGEVPLVTIAIPAFKPAHFAACIDSALAQTYPRLQILVCDDSGGDTLRQIADGRAGSDRIEWIANPATLGGRANFIQCLERARGDYIKFLCDDDLLEPDCVERMVAAFRGAPEATLVFSRRQRIDTNGAPLPDDGHTEPLATHNCVFRGDALAGAVIALQSNFIGEPTTVMFRRRDLDWIRPHYAAFDGHDDIRVVGDIAAWHNLLSQGEAVYIARPLSRFRIHPGQNQARPEIRDLIAESWAKLEHGSHSLGFMEIAHPSVPHREPDSTEWRIDHELPLNRRLAIRAGRGATTDTLPERALRLIDAALARDASPVEAPTPPTIERQRYDQAAALMRAGRTEEGAEALITLASEDSPVWEVYADLAEFALSCNDHQAALDLMLTAAQRAPGERRAVLGAAMLQVERGEFEPALANLSPYLRRYQNDGDALALVRRILGTAPELSPIAWARLLADLRQEAATARATIDRQHAALQQLRADVATALASRTVGSAGRLADSATMQGPYPSGDLTCGQPALSVSQPVQATASGSFLAALGYLAANSLTGFKWFSDEESYLAWDRLLETIQPEIERYVSAHEKFSGYCGLCGQSTLFTVSSGLQLEGHTHLREGMLCAHCGTHNRARLLGLAIQNFAARHGDAAHILLMEATTPLFDHLSGRLPNLIGTEFRSPTVASGTVIDVSGRQVRHENILDLSFADQSLDLIAHADLLEHVPDVETALRECLRTLRKGGELIFSAPFSQTMKQSRKRAELLPSGEIRHFVPEEYHGAHLAYYNFGWDLLDLCRNAGFSSVQVGVCFEPLQGLLSTGRFGGYFMQPIVFSCTR